MSQSEQYLTFEIRGGEHAVPVMRVREIIEYETVTRVPGAPPHVRGVLNLRGAVLPVIDLGAKLGHADSEVTRTTCIVVVETHLGEELVSVGLVADAVLSVVELAADAIEPPPTFGTHVPRGVLQGMGKLDGRLVLLLDLDRLLSPLEVELAVARTDSSDQQIDHSGVAAATP